MPTTPQTALAPCPFCGGAPYRRELIDHYPASADGPAGSYSAWFHVGCDACGIEIGEEYESTAIAAWNRRASQQAPAAIQKAVDALAYIAEREDYTFAECSEAEEIVRRAKDALVGLLAQQAPADVPPVNVHLLWHEACAEWGRAIGGPPEYEIFADKLRAALAASPLPPQKSQGDLTSAHGTSQ